MRRYGRYKNPEDPALCVVEVSVPPYHIHAYQCTRKRGHGEQGLFCKQHAKRNLLNTWRVPKGSA